MSDTVFKRVRGERVPMPAKEVQQRELDHEEVVSMKEQDSIKRSEPTLLERIQSLEARVASLEDSNV